MTSDIRYQVFVSSTFADLKEERTAVSQALMEMNCIPAGMELFPATNDEQFEFIKTVIDESDYYVLIIGGRYGSLSTEGISFTEKEFNYAESRNIEICAFLHERPDDILVSKTDRDAEKEKLLSEFKKRIVSNRLVKYWNDPKELPGKVVTSLNSAIRRKPAVGWVRGNQKASPELMAELLALRKENAELVSRQKSTSNTKGVGESDELNRPIRIDYEKVLHPGIAGNIHSTAIREKVTITVADIIEHIGVDIEKKPKQIEYESVIPEYRAKHRIGKNSLFGSLQSDFKVSTESRKRIELAMTTLGFAEEPAPNMYALTDKGRLALFNIMTQE